MAPRLGFWQKKVDPSLKQPPKWLPRQVSGRSTLAKKKVNPSLKQPPTCLENNSQGWGHKEGCNLLWREWDWGENEKDEVKQLEIKKKSAYLQHLPTQAFFCGENGIGLNNEKDEVKKFEKDEMRKQCLLAALAYPSLLLWRERYWVEEWEGWEVWEGWDEKEERLLAYPIFLWRECDWGEEWGEEWGEQVWEAWLAYQSLLWRECDWGEEWCEEVCEGWDKEECLLATFAYWTACNQHMKKNQGKVKQDKKEKKDKKTQQKGKAKSKVTRDSFQQQKRNTRGSLKLNLQFQYSSFL